MCDAKSAGSGKILTTPSGVKYYGDSKSERAGRAKTMGPGHDEPTAKPDILPPTDTTDCTAYTNAQWDTNCSNSFKFANMLQKPPNPEVACNWQKLCQNILDNVKGQFPGMSISSAHRAGGTTDHGRGKAADIQLLGGDAVEGAKRMFKYIGSSGLPFSQLLFEGRWVHVAYGGSTNAASTVGVFRNGQTADSWHARSGNSLPPDLRWA